MFLPVDAENRRQNEAHRQEPKTVRRGVFDIFEMPDDPVKSDNYPDAPAEVPGQAVDYNENEPGEDKPITVNRDEFEVLIMGAYAPNAEDHPDKPSDIQGCTDRRKAERYDHEEY